MKCFSVAASLLLVSADHVDDVMLLQSSVVQRLEKAIGQIGLDRVEKSYPRKSSSP